MPRKNKKKSKKKDKSDFSIGLGSVPAQSKHQARHTEEDLELKQLQEMFSALGDDIVKLIYEECEGDNIKAMTQLSEMVPDEPTPPSEPP